MSNFGVLRKKTMGRKQSGFMVIPLFVEGMQETHLNFGVLLLLVTLPFCVLLLLLQGVKESAR